MDSIFEISSIVVEGRHLGRTIGFPTANINIPLDCRLPSNGVYIATVKIEYSDCIHAAILNQGFHPTFPSENMSIEAHIFDFDRNIYEKTIEIKYLHKLRNEMHFLSPESLKNQLIADESSARDWFLKKGFNSLV